MSDASLSHCAGCGRVEYDCACPGREPANQPNQSTSQTSQTSLCRELFLITLRPARGIDPVIALRHLLKAARRLGLTCVRITTAPGSDAPMLQEPAQDDVARISTHDQ